ncbi:lamin tail domain-containing protein [Streptomyces sp. NPDC002521]
MSVSSSVRRLTATAAVAAAVVGAVAPSAVAAGREPVRPHAVVYISSVQHNRQGRDDRANSSLNKQWVGITNSSRRAMNLDNWKLSDRDGHTYTFHHVRLAGRATVRVHTGVGRNTATDLYQDLRTRVWDVSADSATLRDAHGRIIDAVSWGRRSAQTGRQHGSVSHRAGVRHRDAAPHSHDVRGHGH